MKKQKNELPACEHCRGAQYVLVYWLERMLHEHWVSLPDLPAHIFKMVPVDHFVYCHCNPRIVFLSRKFTTCQECEGTTWQFTETAETEGWRWKKVENLTADEIRSIPCEYFERCPCGYNDQIPKKREKRKILKEVLSLLDIRIPLPSFGL